MGIVDDVVNVGNSFHQGIGILAALLEVVQQEQEKRSVGIRRGVAWMLGMYRALAIGGPCEVPPVEALLDKHLMLLPHSLLDMPLVSVALIVLLVLLRANPLSIAAAVD